MQTETTGLFVFWIVAGARFLLPLAIPRYPFPGIAASLILDAVDQTIFQQFPGLALEGYQGYDKALDIYYLTIAYVSTLRNWVNLTAFRISRFLFYWRLVGVALFELIHMRWLLLVFPNTFEYFFILCEGVRLRWDSKRMSKRSLIAAAVLIWIVVKLPQEYWIHIAQMDTTDWIKTTLLGMPIDAAWGEVFRSNPGIFLATGAVVVVILAFVWHLVKRRLPPPDRVLSFAAGPYELAPEEEKTVSGTAVRADRIIRVELVEKVVLLSLVCISFAQVLPDVRSNTFQLIFGAGFVVTINTALSSWLKTRGTGWAYTLRQFAVMFVVNVGLILAYALLLSRAVDPVRTANALFYALLLTLLVTLYDRYRRPYLVRFKVGE
jgi:hypothetical protein